jgi:adenylate cyclase
MDNQEIASTVLSNAVIEWLADEALLDAEPAALYGELCQRLRGVGMPILRGQVTFRILHPLYDASTLNWNVERGVVVDNFRPDDGGSEQFLRSPIDQCLA